MSAITRKRFFYINSGNLLSSSSSSFSVAIQLPDYENYDRVVLMAADVPISYYLIQHGFNTFTLREPNFPDVIITITPGNYNVESFPNALSTLLTANSPNGYQYSISYPNFRTTVDTGHFTYTILNASSAVSFIFDINNFLTEQFGFNNGSIATFTPLQNGTSTLESTNAVKFIPEDAVFIHSNIVDSAGSGSFSDVLQALYFSNNVAMGIQSYLCPDPIAFSKKLNGGKPQNITFSFTSEQGNPLFFNGINVVLTIMIFKESDIFEKASRFMKYLMQKEQFAIDPNYFQETRRDNNQDFEFPEKSENKILNSL